MKMVVRTHYEPHTFEWSLNVYLGEKGTPRTRWTLIRNVTQYDLEYPAYVASLEYYACEVTGQQRAL